MKRFFVCCFLMLILLVFLHGGKSHNGEFDVFRDGDTLVVIAQSYPDLSYLKE